MSLKEHSLPHLVVAADVTQSPAAPATSLPVALVRYQVSRYTEDDESVLDHRAIIAIGMQYIPQRKRVRKLLQDLFPELLW